MNWIEISATVAIVSLFLTNIYYIIKNTLQKRRFFALYMYMQEERNALINKLEELVNQSNKNELKNSDGFLKFISDSRDWAFNYIEQTQKALVEFDREISSILEWSLTYGNAVDSIHLDKIKQISLAYDKLKEVLPKDNETPNN